MRKSFILHIDSLDVLDGLTDEQAGIIFKAISAYQKGKEFTLDGILNAVFIPFKNQFIRDEEKYNKIVERNRENGKNGGRPKETQNNPLGLLETQVNPKKADSKNDSDSDSDSDSKNKSKSKSKSNKKFTPPLLNDVISYFKEKGYKESAAITAYNFYSVADWKDSKGNQVLNWKQKMISVWFKDEHKQSTSTEKKYNYFKDWNDDDIQPVRLNR